MQTEKQDRRASHVRRVELETLVEICGKDAEVPAFEAKTIEVSGRGMQVRTRYLPEVGTPLVLRFASDGNEVLVEGVVAWREGADEGGQFGIKFTALDSSSVTALKALCSAPAKRAEAPKAEETADEPYLSEQGAPVKLHIEGLGAPMKARVTRGTPRKLQVGSQLEFLKVGRALQLEDVTAGSRREAHIHSVTVAIEPETQIPQLVVSLRYDPTDVDETPQPTVVGQDLDDEYDDDEYDDEYEEGEYDDEEVSEDIFKGKVGALAANAGRAMKETSVNVAKWSNDALGGIGALVTSSKKQAAKATRRSAKPRRTSRLPQQQAPRRRPQQVQGRRTNSGRQAQPEPSPSLLKRPKVWLYGGAALLSVSAVFALTQGPSESAALDSTEFDAAAVAPVPVPQQPAATPAATGPAPTAPVAPGVLPSAVPGPPSAQSGFPQRATLDAREQLKPDTNGIVAQVPLFGAKQMATSEPAPADPAPMAQVDEYSLAKDQAFTDKVVAPEPAAAESSDSSDSQQSFQVGRMELPIVHRLRLDGPGEVLQGSKTPSGFTVLVPGRKVMENGSAIANRDDRIVNVRVQNTPAGGKVTFRFRKDIPGYKVRLRKDFIEFFVNQPKK